MTRQGWVTLEGEFEFRSACARTLKHAAILRGLVGLPEKMNLYKTRHCVRLPRADGLP